MEYFVNLKETMASRGLNAVKYFETEHCFKNMIHKISDSKMNRRSKKESLKRENKVFVGGIPYSVTTYQLWEFFSKFGSVVDALVVKDKRSRKSKGFGFVSFSNQNGMSKALNSSSDELTLKGRVLHVSLPEPKKQRNVFGDIKENRFKYSQNEGTHRNATNNKTESEVQHVEDVNNYKNYEAKGENQFLDLIGIMKDNNNKTQLLDLNDDVMEEIFSYLSLQDLCRMNSVCKRWDGILKSIWKQKKILDLSYFSIFKGKALTTKILAILLSKTQKGLSELNLSLRSSNLSYFTLEMVGKLCPNLTTLDISGMVVTEDNMIKFSQFCPNLENLTANNCERFNEKAAWRLLHSLQNLTSLSLTANGSFTGKCFKQAGPRLTSLDLDNCLSLTSDGVGLAIKHCPALTHLFINRCSSLDITVVSHLLKSKLTHLDMSCLLLHPNLNDPIEFAKIGNISTLQNLNLVFNDLVSDLLLKNLSTLTDLASLKISCCNGGNNFPGVTDVGLLYLKNIVHLDICYLSGVTDASLHHLSTFKSLKCVEICGSPHVTNAGAEALVTSPTLTFLDLSGCKGISAPFLNQLIAKRSVIMEHLQVLVGGTMAEEMNLQFSQINNVTVQVLNRCIDRLRPDYLDYINYGILFTDSEFSEDDFDAWSNPSHLDDSWNSDVGWGEYEENDEAIIPHVDDNWAATGDGNDNVWQNSDNVAIVQNEEAWEGEENWDDE